jgi:hypothetical protein
MTVRVVYGQVVCMEGEGNQVPMVAAIEGGCHPQSEGLSSKKDYDHHPEED